MKIQNPFKGLSKNTKFKHGSLATAITVIFIVAVVVVNVISTLLVDRFGWETDLTSTRAFDLSSDTLTLLDSVKIPVKITVLSAEKDYIANGDYFSQANKIFDLYAKKNSNITLTYVDTVKNPAALSQYQSINAAAGNIVVESDLRKVLLTESDLFNVNSDYSGNYYVESSKAEYALSTALLSVTSKEQPMVSIMTGHGEDALSGLSAFLTSNNFQVKSQYLTTEGVDANASFVLIGAPTSDYTEADLKKLDAYLYNNGNYGKNILYFASAQQGSLPNLEAFLKDWGIVMGTGVIYETDSTRIFNSNYFAINNYTDTEYAGKLADNDIYPAIYASRQMSKATSSTGARSVKTLLSFASTSVVAPVTSNTTWNPSTAAKSANPSMIMGSTSVQKGTTTYTSNVVAIGSLYFVDGGLLYSTSVTNGEYTINLLNKLINREDVVPLLSKTLGGSTFEITSNQASILNVLFLIVTPLAVLGSGMYVWIRRRHL